MISMWLICMAFYIQFWNRYFCWWTFGTICPLHRWNFRPKMIVTVIEINRDTLETGRIERVLKQSNWTVSGFEHFSRNSRWKFATSRPVTTLPCQASHGSQMPVEYTHSRARSELLGIDFARVFWLPSSMPVSVRDTKLPVEARLWIYPAGFHWESNNETLSALNPLAFGPKHSIFTIYWPLTCDWNATPKQAPVNQAGKANNTQHRTIFPNENPCVIASR